MNKYMLIGMLMINSIMIEVSQAQQGPRNNDNQGPAGGDNRGNGNDGNNKGRGDRPVITVNPEQNLENVEQNLQTLIVDQELSPINVTDLSLPNISEPKAQLGKKLFFAKNLGGEESAACVSCHHPTLGGGDDLSLPVGVAAVDEFNISSHNLLGAGRFNGISNTNLPAVPRNSPTVFNLGLNTDSLFWDGRVETQRGGAIITPDSDMDDNGRRLPDANLPENTTLAAAQARFPITSAEEMRGEFLPDVDNQSLRSQLTHRFDNSDGTYQSTWPIDFEQAYGDAVVTFDRIADALGEYERSMVFVNSPWQAYLNGDSTALTLQQKAGAWLFFSSKQEGGAGCSACHNGPTLSSRRNRLTAYPQFGPGKGNPSDTSTSHDFGRENVTQNEKDRYHFRVPTLLNVAVTAPYGHAGAYQTLEEVVNHYNNPREAINRLFAAQGDQAFINGVAPFCQLPQVADLMQKNNQSCEDLYPDAYANSIATVEHLEQARNGDVEASSPLRFAPRLSNEVVVQIVGFLNSLTDPCIENRDCLSPWIIDEMNEANFPDNNPLIGIDRESNAL
jgi:cytochrome c peroxidase